MPAAAALDQVHDREQEVASEAIDRSLRLVSGRSLILREDAVAILEGVIRSVADEHRRAAMTPLIDDAMSSSARELLDAGRVQDVLFDLRLVCDASVASAG